MARKLIYSLLVIFYACGMSTEELQKEVKSSIIETLKEDLKNLAKPIKNKLGIGGSIKNNEIYFQGDKRDKIISILESQGHSVKRIGG